MVRTIIETEGQEPSTTKTFIDADYRKGIVRYKDIRVGEYKDGAMRLLGEAKKLQEKFDILME